MACGSVEAAFAISVRNGIPITEVLRPGDELEYAQEDIMDKQVVAYYKARNIVPATEISEAENAAAPSGGIGYMAIGIDFIVS